ncbi:hypothetical protein GCM10023095_28790 [Pseudaeromonas paramecii]|uniref:Uncharacterized protein n=1 Tax=Pseudaeromonas paramecii TaxID=2138166 RepID=A0ABP8QGP4_9GAMM
MRLATAVPLSNFGTSSMACTTHGAGFTSAANKSVNGNPNAAHLGSLGYASVPFTSNVNKI